MSPTKYDQLINTSEEGIRDGNLAAVRHVLTRLSFTTVPRRYRVKLANVCRRSGAFAQALKLLTPAVRAFRSQLDAKPDDNELAEYGILLQRVGAVDEALKTLEQVNPERCPEALLYKTFCFFSDWRYRDAIPVIEKYLRAPLTPYAAFVGKVNLLAARLNSGDLEGLSEALEQTARGAEADGYRRLAGNCYEMKAHCAVEQRDYRAAREAIESAGRFFLNVQGPAKSPDQLFLRKWQAFLASIAENSVEPLLLFRQEATAMRHWESVRETDYYSLKVAFDPKIFTHLYYGTPFTAYREKMQLAFGIRPAHGFYDFGNSGGRCFDLLTGHFDLQDLRPGLMLHKALRLMLNDLYRPTRVGSLFGGLFPEEHFNIYSSPDRVHQILRRLRRWMESHAIPVSVDGRHGQFRLSVDGTFSFRLPLEWPRFSEEGIQITRLLRSFTDRESFSPAQARMALGIGKTKFADLARWAVGEGLLTKLGSGPATRYRIGDKAA